MFRHPASFALFDEFVACVKGVKELPPSECIDAFRRGMEIAEEIGFDFLAFLAEITSNSHCK
ncbi:MAG: hypothetical protein HOE80_04820 [Candidatus Magasanikbacteria bacterium]|jgi:hypothetical protein|nr:hypothetical protein [Candidatus Magasanikbacteria bacterium]MBT4072013.1 hypothetical protein [Candidatus Magasanikbacteria bacterium]